MKQQELALFPRWPRAKPYKRTDAEIKAVVRFRDGYRCRECGMTAKEHYKRYRLSLDVHRIVPGSRYTVRGCITLCKECHKGKPKCLQGSRKGNRAINIYVSPNVAKAMNGYIQHHPVNRTSLVQLAIREFLEKRGFWPPKN